MNIKCFVQELKIVESLIPYFNQILMIVRENEFLSEINSNMNLTDTFKELEDLLNSSTLKLFVLIKS